MHHNSSNVEFFLGMDFNIDKFNVLSITRKKVLCTSEKASTTRATHVRGVTINADLRGCPNGEASNTKTLT